MALSSAVVHPKRRTGWLFSFLRCRHIVGFVADINARGIRMDYFQADVLALELVYHLPPLLAVHFVPPAASVN
jgi:hypothetical protein